MAETTTLVVSVTAAAVVAELAFVVTGDSTKPRVKMTVMEVKMKSQLQKDLC